MTVTVDALTEERIQQEIDLGPYREPAEVVSHALDLLAAERQKSSVDRKALEESFGAWSGMTEDGVAYQQRLRDEWER